MGKSLCTDCAKRNRCDMAELGEHPFAISTCYGYEKGNPSNYDRIISKSPEELAEWIAEILFHCSNTICDKKCPMYECCCDQPSDNIEDWLKEEVTDDP